MRNGEKEIQNEGEKANVTQTKKKKRQEKNRKEK